MEGQHPVPRRRPSQDAAVTSVVSNSSGSVYPGATQPQKPAPPPKKLAPPPVAKKKPPATVPGRTVTPCPPPRRRSVAHDRPPPVSGKGLLYKSRDSALPATPDCSDSGTEDEHHRAKANPNPQGDASAIAEIDAAFSAAAKKEIAAKVSATAAAEAAQAEIDEAFASLPSPTRQTESRSSSAVAPLQQGLVPESVPRKAKARSAFAEAAAAATAEQRKKKSPKAAVRPRPVPRVRGASLSTSRALSASTPVPSPPRPARPDAPAVRARVNNRGRTSSLAVASDLTPRRSVSAPVEVSVGAIHPVAALSGRSWVEEDISDDSSSDDETDTESDLDSDDDAGLADLAECGVPRAPQTKQTIPPARPTRPAQSDLMESDMMVSPHPVPTKATVLTSDPAPVPVMSSTPASNPMPTSAPVPEPRGSAELLLDKAPSNGDGCSAVYTNARGQLCGWFLKEVRAGKIGRPRRRYFVLDVSGFIWCVFLFCAKPNPQLPPLHYTGSVFVLMHKLLLGTIRRWARRAKGKSRLVG